MSEATRFEQLRRAILEQARRDAQRVVEQAKAEASASLQRAAVQAEQESQRQAAALERRLASDMEQALAQAQLEAQMLRLEQREALLQRVLAGATEQLASVAAWPNYPQLAVNLAREAVVRLGAPEVVLEADPQAQSALDAATLFALSAELDVVVTLGPALEAGLGVIARTPEGHRRYDNTLAARLERLYPQLRADIYALLVGEDSQAASSTPSPTSATRNGQREMEEGS